MGVAIDRLPSATQMHSDLEAMLAVPTDSVGTFALAWCVNGEAIGQSSLRDIVPGEFSGMRLLLTGISIIATSKFLN